MNIGQLKKKNIPLWDPGILILMFNFEHFPPTTWRRCPPAPRT